MYIHIFIGIVYIYQNIFNMPQNESNSSEDDASKGYSDFYLAIREFTNSTIGIMFIVILPTVALISLFLYAMKQPDNLIFSSENNSDEDEDMNSNFKNPSGSIIDFNNNDISDLENSNSTTNSRQSQKLHNIPLLPTNQAEPTSMKRFSLNSKLSSIFSPWGKYVKQKQNDEEEIIINHEADRELLENSLNINNHSVNTNILHDLSDEKNIPILMRI